VTSVLPVCQGGVEEASWYHVHTTKPFYTFQKRPRLLEQRMYSEQIVLDKGYGGRNQNPKPNNERRDPE